MLWARATQRWSKYDFQGPERDGFAVPWPITYDELAHWYSHVEKFMGVCGNKDGIASMPDGEFLEAYELNVVEKHIQKVIKEKYPAVKLITSAGTDPDGDRFNFLNNALRTMEVDFIDEHFYRRPEWFLQNASRYDQYPRTRTKIFAGEWAAQSERTGSANNKNNWLTALSEAAFMTGMERNADVVQMASYAPLFAHTDAWQWSPNLVWVNNLNAYGTPDYYVQKLAQGIAKIGAAACKYGL